MIDKLFRWFVALTIVIFLVVIVWAMMRLETRTDWCGERGGIMLKSMDGWQCIDAKVMK